MIEFRGLHKLRNISLSSNHITTLEWNDSTRLPNLETLIIHDNHYKSYTDIRIGKFVNLRQLYIDVFENFTFKIANLSLPKLKSINFFPRNRSYFHIRNDSFRGLADSPILNLDLDFHGHVLRPIGENYLSPFKHVKTVRLHFGYYCSIKDVLRSLKGLAGRKIDTLDLSNNWLISGNVQYINDKDLHWLAEICVRNLDLTWDSIAQINSQIIWNSSLNIAKCLEVISLENNDFVKDNYLPILPLANFEKIKSINIAYSPPNNNPQGINMGNSASRQHGIIEWTLREEPMKNVTVYISSSLQSFNSTGVYTNFGIELENFNFVFNATGVRYLGLGKTGMSLCNKNSNNVRAIGNVTFFDMSGWNCSDLRTRFLANAGCFSDLEILDAKNSQLGQGLQRNKNADFLWNITKLLQIDLSNNGLFELPADFFKYQLHSIKDIFLDQNHFNKIPICVLKLQNPRYMSVKANQITGFTKNEIRTFDSWSNLMLDLKGNHFSCDCNNIHSLQWMSNNKVKLVDIDKIPCREDEVILTDVLSNIRRFQIQCIASDWLKVAISLSFLFIVIILTAAISYKYRYNIMLWLFQTRKPRNSQDQMYTYDLFVSYNQEHDPDANWTKTQLYHFLVEKLYLKIAFEEDIEGNLRYMDAIYDLMGKSKAIAVVYSKEFPNFTWSQYHLESAKMQTVMKEKPPLLVIVLDGTPKESVHETFQSIWWKLHFIYWPGTDEGEGLNHFWQHLRAAVQK